MSDSQERYKPGVITVRMPYRIYAAVKKAAFAKTTQTSRGDRPKTINEYCVEALLARMDAEGVHYDAKPVNAAGGENAGLDSR